MHRTTRPAFRPSLRLYGAYTALRLFYGDMAPAGYGIFAVA
nr:MAG TPA: hypothetical protein [Caudoviricetes sp.]DAH85968.1 MAG TPA: hypothetical protein [Caudoviricetes sp.]